jgi:DsbC/DsbD-like thiol-disulfide interchange protein
MNKKVCLSLLMLLLPLVALSASCANNSSPTANANANSTNAVATTNANVATKATPSLLEGKVSASVERVELKAGKTTETSVRLSIADGYHVNANPATEKFLIPTVLNVKPEAGITADQIVYPKPLRKKFPFAEVPLDVYEGDTVIKFKLNAPRDLPPGQHTLRADIRVQPCDDEKCYPPATLATAVEVTVN